MSDAAIRIWPALAKSKINPNIYGHFAEHVGRCIYEGIWVGPRSRIPNEGGMRLDVLAGLKQLRAPVLRWPGGCFADDYHWRAGIGPVSKRPKTANMWWQQDEPNEFGTDEFMRLCETLGCQPYLCCNVGTGSPREARDWVEYCNHGGESHLSRLRARHGSPEPYGVRYWGVGNETWGCGGRFRAEDYAREYARFANYMRTMDPDIELIACGTSFEDHRDPERVGWNHDFCQEMRHPDLLGHLSMHRYFRRGKGAEFSGGEFQALFGDVLALERDLELAEAVLAYFYPEKMVGIIFDEWGVWHPEATAENGLEQPHTLRDALLAAAVLNLFNRWAHRVTMANIAQTINVLQCMAMTDGARMFLTPTYHVFDLMRGHMGATLLTQEVECPTFEARPIGLHEQRAVPALSVSASRTGKRILLSVVNQSLEEDIEATVQVREAAIGNVTGRLLSSDGPGDRNTFESPKRVTPKRLKIENPEGDLVHTFPAHSLTVLGITLD